MQGHFQNTKGILVENLAVRRQGGEGGMVGAARADYKFTNAAHQVQIAIGILGRKALIGVIVPGEYQIRIHVIEQLVKGLRVFVCTPAGGI